MLHIAVNYILKTAIALGWSACIKLTWGFLGSLQEGGPRHTFSSSYMFISALNHDIILKWFSYYLFFVSYHLCRHSLFDIVASILLLKDLPRLIVDATLMLFHYRSSSSEGLLWTRKRSACNKEASKIAGSAQSPKLHRKHLQWPVLVFSQLHWSVLIFSHMCWCMYLHFHNRTYRPGLL